MSVRISSHKHESRNGRSRREFNGDLHSEQFGIVFSCDSLILNLTDGERSWHVNLDETETAALAKRFAARVPR